MKPLEPSELSAYLDGELDAARTKEIERLLASDSELRAEFERMSAMDAAWTSAARTAISRPRVRLDASSSRLSIAARTTLIVAGLLALRLIPKFADLVVVGVLLHSVVLAMILAWVVRREA